MLLKIAYRNLLARPLRTLAVGSIIAFGAFLAVLGGSFVDSMTGSLQRSLTRSVVGDLQVYSDQAKDDFSIFPDMFGGTQKIGSLPDVKKVRQALLKVPGVQDVVPQGLNFASINTGTMLDIKLDELGQAYKAAPRDPARIADLKAHVRRIVENSARNYRENLLPSGIVPKEDQKKNAAALAKALSPAFWAGFDADHVARTEYLSNNIAPLDFENTQVYFSYLGTLTNRMAKAFPLVEIVRGTAIPDGQRGFLINEYLYETQIKNTFAMRLDDIDKGVKAGKRIAENKGMQKLMKRNAEQVDELLSQMSPGGEKAVDQALAGLLPELKSKPLRDKLQAFFTMSDDNEPARYEFFYKSIAPHIVLYRLKVGDSFPLKAFTESGFANAVNMKVWGTFKFRNFEKSPLAGNFSLMDLASFRELYGFQTPERKAQTKALLAEMGGESEGLDLGRDDFEAMFSKAKPKAASEAAAAPKRAVNAKLQRVQAAALAVKSEDEMEPGPALNAAVVLKEGVDPDDALKAIEAANKAEGLGIKVVGWKAASGMLGQVAGVFTGILWGIIALIFFVGAFIIQNAMFMAAMERTTEIGTLRAMGAQRRFIIRMVFTETLLLALVFAGLGVLLGSAAVLWLGHAGIPAPAPEAMFLFSGSRLYLELHPGWPVAALLVTVAISLAASIYPAVQANGITPLRAMQKDQ